MRFSRKNGASDLRRRSMCHFNRGGEDDSSMPES